MQLLFSHQSCSRAVITNGSRGLGAAACDTPVLVRLARSVRAPGRLVGCKVRAGRAPEKAMALHRAISPANLTAWVLTSVTTSFDAIGWEGLDSDVPHDRKIGCIHPPPFGKQCTAHKGDALKACLAAPGCHALSCPSPEPYVGKVRRDGIVGAICQLRATKQVAFNEGKNKAAKHGMCRALGCTNLFLSPVQVKGAGSNVAAMAIRLSELVDAHGAADTHRSWRPSLVNRHLVPATGIGRAFPLVLVPSRGISADVLSAFGLSEELGILPSSAVLREGSGGSTLPLAARTGPYRVFVVPLFADPRPAQAVISGSALRR